VWLTILLVEFGSLWIYISPEIKVGDPKKTGIAGMKNIVVATNRASIVLESFRAVVADHTWRQVRSASELLNACQRNNVELILVELDILSELGKPAAIKNDLSKIKHKNPLCTIIVLGKIDQLRAMVKTLKLGVDDYLTIPIIEEEFKLVLESAAEQLIQQAELDYLRDRFWKVDALSVVKTKSTLMHAVFNQIRSVAPTKAIVLLCGETGTGKGVMAQLLHQHSNRSGKNFIKVHCGAIPDTLLESELFGHEKGAFTGATRKKLGKFEIATEGTIFLDEVGTISPAAQIKLLQVLQDGSFNRVGGEEILTTDARIVAATNIDLKEMTEDGRFRKDLYYRLNVFPIEIPPLRDRIQDIHHLANLFLDRFNQKYQRQISEIHPSVLEAMGHYHWPGNVRELENLIERAYILTTEEMLMPQSFPTEVMGDMEQIEFPAIIKNTTLSEARRAVVEAFESHYIKDVLTANNGKVNKSAEAAGVGVRQFHKLMKKYNINKKQQVNSKKANK
jgi:DNA-binding NtrC family response regulator